MYYVKVVLKNEDEKSLEKINILNNNITKTTSSITAEKETVK